MTKTVTPTAAPAAIPTSTGCFGWKQLFPFPESIVGSKLKNKNTEKAFSAHQQPNSNMHSVSEIPMNPQDLILLEIAALQYSVGAIFLQRNGLFSRQGESFQVPISSMATQSSASCLKITFLFF